MRIYNSRYFVSFHLSGIIRLEHGKQESFILDNRIKPKGLLRFGNDNRHSIMNRLNEFVRSGGNNRTRAYLLSFGRSPYVVETSNAKWRFGFEVKIHRSFRFPLFPQFVKSISDNETPMFFKSSPKTRFFIKCLRTRVDHLVPDGWILCPGRDKTPAELNKAISAIINNGSDIVARSYIAAWVNVTGDLLNLKLFLNDLYSAFAYETPRHLILSGKVFSLFVVFYILLYFNAHSNNSQLKLSAQLSYHE